MSEASVETAQGSVGAAIDRVKRFNISKWALDHPALTRYLLVVFLVLGLAA